MYEKLPEEHTSPVLGREVTRSFTTDSITRLGKR
ncbi:hypothetical protein ES288_D05G148300v1 [Gossypium darwinii]|uniref:Uncharacterized protein n=1 Tax=Gossypium darwinii TaxID=34276 RepID=A0A5D2CI08_GOSDA|nr:hypothetical protein ES288_D05G148300v1 [Gossypium darwinii]